MPAGDLNGTTAFSSKRCSNEAQRPTTQKSDFETLDVESQEAVQISFEAQNRFDKK